MQSCSALGSAGSWQHQRYWARVRISITVIDAYDRVDGNHIDVITGPYTFDVGSFIFQDNSPLLTHFPGLMNHYVAIEPTWSRLTPQGVVTTYPFSARDDLLADGGIEMARMFASAVVRRLMHRRGPRNAGDYARRALSPRFLARSGLKHYMERLSSCPIDMIDLDFARSAGWLGS